MEKQYYWAEDLEDYQSDNLIDEKAENPVIEIKRLNFFIGKNNAGKSRFLRNLFKFEIPVINELDNSHFFNIKKLKNDFNWLNESNINHNKKTMNNMADEIINPNTNHADWQGILEQYDRPYDEYGIEHYIDINILKKYLNTFNFLGVKRILIVQILNDIKDIIQSKFDVIYPADLNKEIDESRYFFEKYIDCLLPYIQKNDIPIKYYIPILRGMRPTNDAYAFPYLARTQKDYFSDVQHLEGNQIITGENLYSLLQKQLLGKAQEWQRVRLYEQKLSQYFFNGETVTLIPELESDVLSIKIGNDEQFPISQLGDGLQQIIILTYQSFIEQDAVCSFSLKNPNCICTQAWFAS